MKKYVIMIIALALSAMLVPKGYRLMFGSLGKPKAMPDSFPLTLVSTGKTISLTPEEYVSGCLLAQIPLDYEMEALKAQASAAYTYGAKILSEGGILSDSPEDCQPYFTPQQGKEYYGDDYEKYLDKIKEAAEYGVSHMIVYENQPIYSVYHSVSAGKTQSARNVWGTELPYLQPVDSPWDASYGNFTAENQFTTETMRVKFLHYDRGITMPVDYSLWFQNAKTDESGYVISMQAGNRELSGGELWRIIGLRSTAFEIKYNGTVFSVVTKGYGHGVGLSQYGANQMALSGETAEEILTYYYTGVKVIEI